MVPATRSSICLGVRSRDCLERGIGRAWWWWKCSVFWSYHDELNGYIHLSDWTNQTFKAGVFNYAHCASILKRNFEVALGPGSPWPGWWAMLRLVTSACILLRSRTWNVVFILCSISDQKDARERMVQVVKWYLSAFHAGRKGSVAKKPYNPILGEIFQCHWTLPNDTEENAVSSALMFLII